MWWNVINVKVRSQEMHYANERPHCVRVCVFWGIRVSVLFDIDWAARIIWSHEKYNVVWYCFEPIHLECLHLSVLICSPSTWLFPFRLTYTSFELTITERDGAWNTSIRTHLKRHSVLTHSQVMYVAGLSVFAVSMMLWLAACSRFICCVSHDIFIRVGFQRVGGDQFLSGL